MALHVTLKGGLGMPTSVEKAFESEYGMELEVGRDIADQLIKAKGTAHVGEVLTEMRKRGFVLPDKGYWVAHVFRGRPDKYQWTGEKVQASGHDKLAMVWRFRKKGD